MDQIIIVANSDGIVKAVEESFKIITRVHFESITHLEQAHQMIREKKPSLVFLCEDLMVDQMNSLHQSIKNDSLIPYLPLVYICKKWDPKNSDWILKGKLIDDWIALDQSISERLFRLNHQILFSSLRKELQQMKIDFDYVSAELVYFVRSNQKEKQKKDKQRLVEMIDIMHYLRTFLTGIKGGASLLNHPDTTTDQRENALALIMKNIKKMDDYINENDLTVKNEYRKKPPIKIVKINHILEAVSPKIQLTAEKKNLSVFFEKSGKDYSVLLHHPEILPSIRAVLIDFVNASLSGSTVEIGFDPLYSANLLRIYSKNLTHRVDRNLLQHFLDEAYDVVNILNDAESRFELFSDSLFTGIQFYLPRLD